MIIMKIIELLEVAKSKFTKENIENPDLNARILLSEVTVIKRLMLDLYLNEEVSQEQEELFLEYIERRSKNEPIQHILGYTEFFDLRIQVSKDVLIPRPETEYLIEIIDKRIRDKDKVKRIIDIGTGSGVIALMLRRKFPSADLVAIDISSQALAIARENAKINNLEVNFVEADLFNDELGSFDLIVSNPPYVTEEEYKILPKEVRDFEPKLALVGEEEGLVYYRKIIELSRTILNAQGSIFFEIGERQGKAISLLAKKNGFSKFETIKDLVGRDRFFVINNR